LVTLIEGLPVDSATARSMNDGAPVWTLTEELLADLWVLMVRVNSPKDALPMGFDHPLRASTTVKAKSAAMAALKAKYQQRKHARAQRRREG
jgi:hypothetical protein